MKEKLVSENAWEAAKEAKSEAMEPEAEAMESVAEAMKAPPWQRAGEIAAPRRSKKVGAAADPISGTSADRFADRSADRKAQRMRRKIGDQARARRHDRRPTW